MVKEIEFDYKGGQAFARLKRVENYFEYNWKFHNSDGVDYGDASKWPENPGDDAIIRITKININNLINQVKK